MDLFASIAYFPTSVVVAIPRFFSIFTLFIATAALAGPAEPTGVLRWGADSEGGAPYVFQDPKSPTHIIGFEVDLADAIAADMGLKAAFVQNQWDGLVPGLNRGNYDIVINGLEITEDRKQEVAFAQPYYWTYEQLTIRKESSEIARLGDLRQKIAGTLKGSLAERILRDHGDIEIRSYEGQINAYEDLLNKRLDAVLMDWPIARYYGVPHAELTEVGEPLGEMSYGIAIKKDNRDLLAKVNTALDHLRETGKLKEILATWGLWTPMVAKQLHDTSANLIRPIAYEKFLESIGKERPWREKAKQYLSYLPMLGQGAIVTLELSLLGMLLAVSLGLVVALLRVYGSRPLSFLATAYIEVVRGTPLLIQLFLIFYGLPNIGIRFSPFMAAVLGLGLNYAAYEAENYRAGIGSVPRHQMESAFALGMSRWQALRHVIIPQALRLVIPPVTNDFISLLKDSSLVSVITMVELTKIYGQLASTYYDYFGIGLLTAAVYFLIGLPFVRLARWLELRYHLDALHARNQKSIFPVEASVAESLPVA